MERTTTAAQTGSSSSSLLFQGFSNKSLAGFREEEHTVYDSPPVQDSPFLSTLWKWGSAGFSRGNTRVRNGIKLLACSLSRTWAQITVAHADLCYQWYTQIGTKTNYLACLGPEFSSLQAASVLRKANAMKFNRREEPGLDCFVLFFFLFIFSISLPQRQALQLL